MSELQVPARSESVSEASTDPGLKAIEVKLSEDGAGEPQLSKEPLDRLINDEEPTQDPSASLRVSTVQTGVGPEYKALNSLIGGVPVSRLSADMSKHDIGLISTKTDEEGPPKKTAGIFKAYRFATKRDWAMLCVAWLLNLGNGILVPLNFVVLGDLFAEMMDMSMDIFKTVMRYFIILGCVALLTAFGATFLLELSAERQLRRVKLLYLESVMRQEVGYFDIKDCGSLAAEVEAASVQIRHGVGTKSGMIAKSMAIFFGSYAVGLWKNWRMTLVLTAMIPVLGISIAVLVVEVEKFTSASRKAYERAGSVAEETFPAFRTVASFGLEQKFSTKFDGLIDESLKNDMRNVRARSLGVGVLMLTIFAAYALGWWYGGSKVVASSVEDNGIMGLVAVGGVITCFFAIMTGSFTIGFISAPVALLSTAAKAASDLDEMISRKSLIPPEAQTGETRHHLDGRVEFKSVRFCYPSRPQKQVYKDVSFVMEAGQRVALVGPSGCGKSTIVQLLERFYDQESGQIFVDDLNHRLYNVQWLRSQIALVSQEPRLFCDTIYKNIQYGKKDATREQIIQAAKEANAHNFIMQLPQGYETNVGLGGSLLSGGQKQRVAIARAILRDPSILILDEATSALDNHSERIVQDALDKLLQSRRRTTIVIAHRLTTIRGADKIIVLDNKDGHGSFVIESGTHDELMNITNGVYKTLVTAQAMQAGGPTTPEERAQLEEIQKEELMHRLSVELGGTHPRGSRASSVGRMMLKYSTLRDARQVSTDEIVAEVTGKKKEEKLPKLSYLNQYLGRDSFVNYLGYFWAAVLGACFPLMVVLISKFLDSFMTYDDFESPEWNADRIRRDSAKYAGYFVALAAVFGIGGFLEDLSFGFVGERLVSRLRKRAYENTIHQDAEFFDDPRYNTGFLSSVLSADCETAKMVTGQNISVYIQTIFQLIAAIIIAFVSSARVAAVTASLYLIAIPSGIVQSKLTRPITVSPNAINEQSSPAFVMNEVVTNLKVVAAYGLQKDMRDMYTQALSRNLSKGRRNCWITAAAASLTDGVMYFSSALSFWYAGTLLTTERITVEQMMNSVMTIMIAGQRMSEMSEFTANRTKARAAIGNIKFLLERKPKMDARDPEGAKTEIKGKVELDHVKFRYPGRPTTPVLADISFIGSPGQTIALVGESGSGKSTVVQFLERFYDVEASPEFRLAVREHNDAADPLGLERLPSSSDMFGGVVKVDDRNVTSYNLQHLRRCLGHVGQEPVLFDMSIRENIKNGKPEATDEEVVEAAKAANAHDFIMQLGEGYDTNVGKGGSKLSGGQKQRIAIARAIIRDPKILLLDEATSALDPEAEEVVQKALDKLMESTKRTTIVIAHRLSTIRNADKIIVFGPEPGVGSKIIESGSHEELIKIPKGVYRHLVHLISEK